MSQKNLSVDPGTETMSSPAVAGEAGQWDRTRPATESRLGLPVEGALRLRGAAVVSRPLASAPCAGSQSVPHLRAAGGASSSQAQRSGQSLGVLRCRGHLPRAGRVGSASPAQHPYHPSGSGPQPAGGPQAPGSLAQGANVTHSDFHKAERCASDGLYRGALSGPPLSCRGVQPTGCRHGTGRRDRGARSTGPAGAGARSRFSTRPFGFPSDTRTNSSAWSSERVPRLSRCTGDLRPRGD